MTYRQKAYVEHTAIRVKDIRWYINFFQEALNMPVKMTDGDKMNPAQVWLNGGIQLISESIEKVDESQLAHIGIMVEDLDDALNEVYKWGVTEMKQGHNWVKLPDGLCLELLQEKR